MYNLQANAELNETSILLYDTWVLLLHGELSLQNTGAFWIKQIIFYWEIFNISPLFSLLLFPPQKQFFFRLE